MPALRDNCVIITSAVSGTSSVSSWQKNMWSSVCKLSSHFTWVFTVLYCLPEILGVYYVLVWDINQEYLRTPRVSSGVEILAGGMVAGYSTYSNYATTGSILWSAASRIPSYFVIPTSCYISIVGMSWNSNSSGSVSAPADVGSISVSGYIRLICGDSFSPSSTPVIPSSPIWHFLQSNKSRLLCWNWPHGSLAQSRCQELVLYTSFSLPPF